MVPGGRYTLLVLAVAGFVASCITLYGAWATFTKTTKDDPWARRIKAGYYEAWGAALRLFFWWKRNKRKFK